MLFVANLIVQKKFSFISLIEWLVYFKNVLHFEIISVSLCDNLTACFFLSLQLHSNSSDKLLTQVSSGAVNNLFVSENLILCLIVLIIGSSSSSTFLYLFQFQQ